MIIENFSKRFTKNCHKCKYMVLDEDINDMLCLMNDGATCNITALELYMEDVLDCDAFVEGKNDFNKELDSKHYMRYGEDR